MLTVAIPTYNRGLILCDTIDLLLRLEPLPDEIVIVDQTPQHPPAVEARLREWEAQGLLRVVRLPKPSITHAMNTALRVARHHHVLFVDDDIIPSSDLVLAHSRALAEPGVWAVVGQVLQPGEEPRHFEERELRKGPLRDLEFRFNHDRSCDVQNVIACNLSVDRTRALEIGGFDENFVDVAYRFETDFALRVVAAGGRVRFDAQASVRHLKIAGGGVRTWGDHRSSSSPAHSVGDYYFALKHVPAFWSYVALRLKKNIATRFHLRRPWTIPPKTLGEFRGLIKARSLSKKE
jgi:GT2 family glycosyltransferase